jgi:hypothetical protein
LPSAAPFDVLTNACSITDATGGAWRDLFAHRHAKDLALGIAPCDTQRLRRWARVPHGIGRPFNGGVSGVVSVRRGCMVDHRTAIALGVIVDVA